MLESRIESELVSAVRAAGGVCEKWGWQGWPDRLIVLPGNRVGFVELKRPGEGLEPLQAARLRKLQGLGSPAEFIASLAGVTRFVEALRA